MPPEVMRMEQAPKSAAEIQSRLDRINDVLEDLSPTDKKYQQLMFERADLLQELEFAGEDKEESPDEPDNVVPIESGMDPEEKKEREARRDLNSIFAVQMGKMLSYPNASASGLQNMARRLSNPQTVERLLRGEIGKEYFTRDITRDQKAMELAENALDAILEEAA